MAILVIVAVGETVAGTINILCSDRFTDIGEGATYQSNWVDVAGWPERAP